MAEGHVLQDKVRFGPGAKTEQPEQGRQDDHVEPGKHRHAVELVPSSLGSQARTLPPQARDLAGDQVLAKDRCTASFWKGHANYASIEGIRQAMKASAGNGAQEATWDSSRFAKLTTRLSGD